MEQPTQYGTRPAVFYAIVAFLSFSAVFLLLGQTVAVFDYDLTVKLGLQETADEISQYGVALNRAFGVADTVIYIPLILISLVGLWQKRRWALLTTVAVMGISAYWATTVAFMFFFLPGTPGYSFNPGVEYWVALSAYILFGLWGLIYLTTCGERLIE